MSDDFLKQFSNALADEHDGATAVPEATRGRVIRALAEKRRNSRKWWLVGIPALAIFGGSTAWAAATGKLPAIIEQAVAVFIEPASEPTTLAESNASKLSGMRSQSPHQAEAPLKAPDNATDPVVEPENELQPTEAQVAPLTHLAAPTQTATSTPVSLPSVQKNDAREPELPPGALATYRKAHRAQFQDGDCTAAISGYQEYLHEEPSGSFALEAKYNRAVCLAKMGQTSEAVQALRPFADGQSGGYRQEKSRELIEALEQSAPE